MSRRRQDSAFFRAEARARIGASVVLITASWLLGGCASHHFVEPHAVDNRVHTVATAPPTCPVCALYHTHRDNVVRLRTSEGQGAGVVLSEAGDILTSAHVVAAGSDLQVELYDGQTYPGEIVLADVRVDLAVVRARSVGHQWLPIAFERDEPLPIGSRVYVIGHPAGLGWTVTQGIVSAYRRAGEAASSELIQTDAAISPGNSGGPLLDEHGHLAGIVRAKLVGPGIENVAFAVPMAAVEAFLRNVPAGAGGSASSFGAAGGAHKP